MQRAEAAEMKFRIGKRYVTYTFFMHAAEFVVACAAIECAVFLEMLEQVVGGVAKLAEIVGICVKI